MALSFLSARAIAMQSLLLSNRVRHSTQMELEARDCKLRMWKQTRETVAEMVSGWVAD